MRVSTVVMAHPVREQAVSELRGSLDRDVEVVWDGKSVPSKRPEQRWRTGHRAWEMVDRSADYGMVIQDDIMVAKDFIGGVEKALSVLGPDGLVSAYTGTGRPDQNSVKRAVRNAEHAGTPWAEMRSLCWGPAIIVPTSQISPMLDWCNLRKNRTKNYDYRIGLYFRDVMGWKTFYLIPSLVEHRKMPSLVGHDYGPVRESHRFIGERASALKVDYSRLPLNGLDPKLKT